MLAEHHDAIRPGHPASSMAEKAEELKDGDLRLAETDPGLSSSRPAAMKSKDLEQVRD